MTQFEAQVDHELALVLADITRAYEHRGRAARAAFLQRLRDAIPAPDAPDPTRRNLPDITGQPEQPHERLARLPEGHPPGCRCAVCY